MEDVPKPVPMGDICASAASSSGIRTAFCQSKSRRGIQWIPAKNVTPRVVGARRHWRFWADLEEVQNIRMTTRAPDPERSVQAGER
jgi:hypothetical protein